MKLFLPDQWTVDALGRALHQRWSGCRIHGVDRRGARVVALRIRGGEGRRPELVATAWPGRGILHPSEQPIDLPLLHREPDRALAPFLKGARIEGIRSSPGARTLLVDLDVRSIGTATLHLVVAGHRADIALLAEDQRIAGLPQRTTKRAGPRTNSPGNLFQALSDERPLAPPNALREAAHQRGLDTEGPPETAADCLGEVDRLAEQAAASETGFAYRRDGAVVAWSPIRLQHLEGSCEREDAPDVIEFLDTTYRETLPLTLLETTRQSLLQSIDRDVRTLERRLEHVEEDLARCLDAERFQRKGEALLASLHAIRKGMTEATIADPYDSDGATVVISLNPAIEPQANADTYFRRARKARDGKIRAEERLAGTRDELAERRRERTRVADATDAGELGPASTGRRTEKTAPHGRAGTPRRSARRKGRITEDDLPLRRYELPGGWKVLAARNARDNDVLTTKVARLADLWFHARGTTGSHVVLKCAGRKAEPDRRTIETVAAIAAWHSKARHSKLVPVAYTERRHVRKMRGAPPGTVTLSRESVVFVEPRLPDGYRH